METNFPKWSEILALPYADAQTILVEICSGRDRYDIQQLLGISTQTYRVFINDYFHVNKRTGRRSDAFLRDLPKPEKFPTLYERGPRQPKEVKEVTEVKKVTEVKEVKPVKEVAPSLPRFTVNCYGRFPGAGVKARLKSIEGLLDEEVEYAIEFTVNEIVKKV